MNENDIQDILQEVRHWLINGADGDLSDLGLGDEQVYRIRKLRAFMKLRLREELLAYRFMDY